MFDEELLRHGRLRAHHAGPVLTLSLSSPQSRNSQLPQTWEALAHIGSAVDDSVRVVIVRGDGPSFSAGLDRSAFAGGADGLLGRIAAQPDAEADALIAGFQRGFSWLADPSFVSIAAVQGHAIGAGFQLALACDLVIAASDAQFRMAEVTLGLVPDLGGTGRLVRAVGRQRALEICATGRAVTATEAVRIGIALMSVPPEELDSAAHELAASLLAADPDAIRAVSRLIAGAETNDVDHQFAAERSEQLARIRARAEQSAQSAAPRVG